MTTEEDKAVKRWFPLESNPTVMNQYVEKMGFPTGEYSFCDVFSTDDWALEMVPTPVVAVIMLFPIKEHTEAYAKEEEERIKANGQIISNNVYYMHQTVEDGSYLSKFFSDTVSKQPTEIAQYLEDDNELEETHGSAADAGQSEQLESVDDPINTHFICFSCVDGHLYELDGRKKFPINHGPSSQETLLKDACQVIKQFMARDEGEVRFTILALAKTPSD